MVFASFAFPPFSSACKEVVPHSSLIQTLILLLLLLPQQFRLRSLLAVILPADLSTISSLLPCLRECDSNRSNEIDVFIPSLLSFSFSSSPLSPPLPLVSLFQQCHPVPSSSLRPPRSLLFSHPFSFPAPNSPPSISDLSPSLSPLVHSSYSQPLSVFTLHNLIIFSKWCFPFDIVICSNRRRVAVPVCLCLWSIGRLCRGELQARRTGRNSSNYTVER